MTKLAAKHTLDPIMKRTVNELNAKKTANTERIHTGKHTETQSEGALKLLHRNDGGKTFNKNPAIKILPGFIARVRVRCGKATCRCRLGARHTAYYRVTYSRGFRVREYVRRYEVDDVRAACEAHRTLQAQLRAGRAEYKELLAQTRWLVKLLRE